MSPVSFESISAIIFDIGDTLYHSFMNLIRENRRFLSELGIADSREFHDSKIQEALIAVNESWLNILMIERNVGPHWEPTRDEWIEYNRRFLVELGIDNDTERIASDLQTKWDDFIDKEQSTLVKGAKETLDSLKRRGYVLAIASNRFGDPRPILEREGLMGYFKGIEYTNIPGYKKPSPYMLLKVATDLGINPRKCAYVGNMVKFDVVSARDASMMPILVTLCNPEQKDLAPKDTIIIEEIAQLLDLFT
ncbi:MAG: HAD family hydrolase [Candidatus Thorarchaeota archaeon]|jgi:FMN phosphatase YigB (HAD superfamily)